jgi:diguanylate cyclase (GGDEF)-like protein
MPRSRREATPRGAPPRPQRFALFVALSYIALASVWITVSDRLTAALTFNPAQMAWVQSLKGIGFVLVTGVLLYTLVLRYARQLDRRDRVLRRQHDRLAAVNRVHDVLRMVNASLLRINDRDLLLEEACRALVRGGGFPCAWIGLLDEDDGALRPAASASAEGLATAGIELSAAELATPGPVADALRGGEFARIESGTGTLLDQGGPPGATFAEIAIVPLRSGGDVIGLIAIHANASGVFDDREERALLTEIADNIGLGVGYLRQQHTLQHLSYHDDLTGVGNRALIENRLVQAVNASERSSGTIAAVVLDIDGFRAINDTSGRNAGDRALQAVAERLSERIRPGDSIGRLGNDEFAVVFAQVDERNPVSRLAARLADAFPARIDIDGQEIYLTVSMGVAVYPDDAGDAHDLLARAELALHSGTEGEAGTITWYAAALDLQARERREIERALRHSVETNDFHLAWQPVVDLETGATVGAEVLLRWHHPELGEIAPDRFIPVAEQTGLIAVLGRRVANEACAQAAAWSRAGHRLDVAVNVSLQELKAPGFVGQMRRILDLHAGSGWRLVLELTESQFMADPEPVIATCRALKEMGCAIYIDDFGTGYSALNYLTHLPLDGLKIDRSFVVQAESDRGVRAIIRAVVALARELDLDVVGEGVETERQLELVREFGCHKVQGYWYGRPEPAPRFAERLRFQTRRHG